jgi:hypothetical protein
MRRLILSVAGSLVFAFSSIPAQSPAPVIIQAVTSPGGAPATKAATTTDEEATLAAVVKALQEIKTANDETLKKQEATLIQLDELEKAAEQIKVFTKRG